MIFFRFLINTNIYVALGAVFLTLETQVQLGFKPQWHPYLFIIFFCTLLDYNFHRLITLVTNKEAMKAEKHQWVMNNLKLFYTMTGLSVLGFIIAISQAKLEVLVVLLPLAFLTLFYTLPIAKKKSGYLRLRDVPCLKIFLISFVWSAVTVYLPVVQKGIEVNNLHLGLIFLERFLFVFAITIPFDIRDMVADRMEGIKTIPLIFGVQNSMRITKILIVIFLMVCLIHYLKYDMNFLIPAFVISSLSTLIFLSNKKIQNQHYYHYGILDGTILLQGVLVCFSQF